MKKSGATDQLRRLIQIIPILNANPGITLADLKKITDYPSENLLRRDIEKMILYGVPPFSPADFIDIWIEDDRIYLQFAAGMDRPLELSPPEWAVVQKIIAEELEIQTDGGDSRENLVSVQKKMSDFPVSFESSLSSKNRRLVIEEAISENLQLEFRYKTISSKEPEIRRVDPWALISQRGITYLIAHCFLRNSPRIFHLERMENIEIVDIERTHEPPQDLNSMISDSLIFKAPSGFKVKIAFEPVLENAVEYNFFPVSVAEYDGTDHRFKNWLTADCPVNESIWFRSMVRSFGRSMVILSPEHMRKSFLEEMNEIQTL